MSGEGLVEARNLIGLARSACGDDPDRWEYAVRVLAALVAEIDAAPVVGVYSVELQRTLEAMDGKRVRLLAEDK